MKEWAKKENGCRRVREGKKGGCQKMDEGMGEEGKGRREDVR